MDGYELILIQSEDDVEAYHRIRHHVLFDGSSAYLREGPDEVREENLSLLLKRQDLPLGTVRLDQKPDCKAIIRLVSIASDMQRQGHGAVLMRLMEQRAASLGIEELFVHARPAALGFYTKLGYDPFTFEPDNSESIQLHKLLL